MRIHKIQIVLDDEIGTIANAQFNEKGKLEEVCGECNVLTDKQRNKLEEVSVRLNEIIKMFPKVK